MCFFCDLFRIEVRYILHGKKCAHGYAIYARVVDLFEIERVIAGNESGAPNGNFRENICSEDDLRTRIFGTFVVKFLACLPLLRFSNIYKMV